MDTATGPIRTARALLNDNSIATTGGQIQDGKRDLNTPSGRCRPYKTTVHESRQYWLGAIADNTQFATAHRIIPEPWSLRVRSNLGLRSKLTPNSQNNQISKRVVYLLEIHLKSMTTQEWQPPRKQGGGTRERGRASTAAVGHPPGSCTFGPSPTRIVGQR